MNCKANSLMDTESVGISTAKHKTIDNNHTTETSTLPDIEAREIDKSWMMQVRVKAKAET